MSKVYTDPQNYTNIAEAIRDMNGTEETYKPAEMPAAIRAIETEPVIQALTVTQNGTYQAPSGVDGYAPITVSVSGGSAIIQPLTVTQNGTYTAPSGIDGYSPVRVNVSGGGEDILIATCERIGIWPNAMSGIYSEEV